MTSIRRNNSLEGVRRLGAVEQIASFGPELLINAVSLQNTVSCL